MSVAWFALGGATWSLSEYLIHRFVGHGPKRTPPRSVMSLLTPSGLAAEFNREHLAHHTDPMYFAPSSRKALAAAAVVPAMTAALSPVLGLRRAASFAAGFSVTYATYEVIHRRIHTHGPTGRYGRWVRRHHLHHHYRTPRDNHGVTTPFWDSVFGTRKPLERLRVPRRSAPAWLVDERGEVRPELAGDYELVGSRPQAAVATATG